MRFTRSLPLPVVLLSALTLALPLPAAATPYLDEIEAAARSSMAKDVALSKHYVQVHGMLFAVKGQAARRHVRFALLALQLDGDRRRILLEEGFPTFRHRENDQDRITEFWTYLDTEKTYVFEGDRLLRTEPY